MVSWNAAPVTAYWRILNQLARVPQGVGLFIRARSAGSLGAYRLYVQSVVHEHFKYRSAKPSLTQSWGFSDVRSLVNLPNSENVSFTQGCSFLFTMEDGRTADGGDESNRIARADCFLYCFPVRGFTLLTLCPPTFFHCNFIFLPLKC